MATVYAVASAKGGVGKTTTAANLAVSLASTGEDVVAVDADIGMANLAGALGVDVDEPTLHDVLAGHAEPTEAIKEGPGGLLVIPGETDLDAYADADPAGLSDVLAAVDDADYVVLDCGAGLSHDSALPIGLADETLLVSTAERDALIDTEKTRELTDRLGGDVAGTAITRVSPNDDVDALAEELLDAPILGRIPEDEAVARAVAAGEPVCTFAPHSNAAAAYRALASALTGVEVPEPDLADATVEAEAHETTDVEETAPEPGDEEKEEEAGAGSEPEQAEEATAPTDAESTVESQPESEGSDATEDGTEAEAVVESGAAETETETSGEAEAEAKAEAKTAEGDADADATIAEAEPDRDDEDVGSVPFQDSDRDVPGSESPVAGDDGPITEAEDTGEGESTEGDDAEEAEGKKGFFSRLFGR